MNEQEHTEILARLDRIEFTLDRFIEYTLKRDADDFTNDVIANIVADTIFEAIVNPDYFFDRGKK